MSPDPLVLQLRLTHMREQIISQLVLHNEDINRYVRESVEKALSDRNIAKEIDVQVNKTITEAIDEIGKNWEVKRAIHKIVTDSLYAFNREKSAHERPEEAGKRRG